MGNGTRALAVLNAEMQEKENPLKTVEMTVEDDYAMIDGQINNGRREKRKKGPPSANILTRRNGNVPKGLCPSVAAYEQEQEVETGVVLLPG